MKKEKATKRVDDWWPNTAPAEFDTHQENKPKLTQEEIENAAKIHKSFVDPHNMITLSGIIQNKFHRDTYHEFWRLSQHNNRNPVDHPYSVDQYIKDKKLYCPNKPCHCGACECE